jgi:hypothetical protein
MAGGRTLPLEDYRKRAAQHEAGEAAPGGFLIGLSVRPGTFFVFSAPYGETDGRRSFPQTKPGAFSRSCGRTGRPPEAQEKPNKVPGRTLSNNDNAGTEKMGATAGYCEAARENTGSAMAAVCMGMRIKKTRGNIRPREFPDDRIARCA